MEEVTSCLETAFVGGGKTVDGWRLRLTLDHVTVERPELTASKNRRNAVHTDSGRTGAGRRLQVPADVTVVAVWTQVEDMRRKIVRPSQFGHVHFDDVS